MSSAREAKSTREVKPANAVVGPSFRIGWREYVALPGLGLPVLKAKVDTGARTSALHAFKIVPFTRDGREMVRFHVHPVQRRSDIVVICEAPVIDQRMISDSGGHRERRYVIETTLVLNNRRWLIEMTLTNRESMVFRMLLGRTAMQALVIEPAESYLLGRPEKVIRAYKKTRQTKRVLKAKGETKGEARDEARDEKTSGVVKFALRKKKLSKLSKNQP